MPMFIARRTLAVATGTALAAFGLTTTVSATAATHPGGTHPAIAYVIAGGGNDVYPINTATNKTGKPVNVRSRPFMLVATPDGRFVYANTGQGIAVIKVATNSLVKVIRIAGGAGMMAIGPKGKTLYVAGVKKIIPIFTSANTLGKPFGPAVDQLAITPDGKFLFAFNSLGSTVTPINLATRKARPAIAVGHSITGIAFSPDSRTAYVVSDPFNGQITAITVATGKQQGDPIDLPQNPEAIAISPNGRILYVANDFNGGAVLPVNVITRAVGTEIPTGSGPIFIGIPPHGKTAYVANEFDRVITPINLATNTAEKAIPVGLGPRMIAFTPDGKKAYVPNDGIFMIGNGFRVSPINTARNTSTRGIFVAINPSFVAIAP